jgi:hypothetical protein
MINYPEIRQWDCDGWHVTCLCGETIYVTNNIHTRTDLHACERCGTEIRLEPIMEVVLEKRGEIVIDSEEDA